MRKKTPRNRQRGMSLVEIMVGVLIGMIAIIVIFQVLAVYEGRKRTASGAGDAQATGAIALYMLDRDVRLSGYGFSDAADIGCAVQGYDALAGAPVAFSLAPVIISKPNGAAGPDSIIVLHGNSPLFVAGKGFVSSTDTTKVMQTGARPGFLRGDIAVVAAEPATATCALIEITDNSNPDTVTLTHAESGNYTSDYHTDPMAVRYAKEGGLGITFTQGFAYNLGPNPARNVWSIGNNRLRYADSLHPETGAIEIADGALNLKAEYGIDANLNNKLEENEWRTADPTTPAEWRAVRAIRIALLMRSAEWDKTVCSANPQWTSGASGVPVLTDFVMRDVDGSPDSFADCEDANADPNNWRTYRYRVYETIVPLRNMIWGTAP